MLIKKTLLSAFVIAALTSTALTPISSFAETPAISAAVSGPVIDISKGIDFAQNHSDIKADPAVRFGKLPNGMTYIILKNTTPPGTASMRLRINGGSLMEDDTQQGLAHFLEHMAFNGSKNVPEGDMIKILERHGLSFGADTNAHTGFGETVYELDLPKVADDDLDTGLMLLRETAGNLTLADDAIDRERGVILGEERASDSPGRHAYMKWAKSAFDGQKYAVRLPIGLTDIIKNAKRDHFVDYYRNFYRPEQATLVLVGDFDPTAMEAKIKAKFSDWTAPAAPIRVTDFGNYKPKGVTSDTYTEKGLRASLSLTWSQPANNSYQTNDSQTRDFLDGLRTSILNDRLERLAKMPDTPFAGASVVHDDVEHTAKVTQLDITPKPGKEKEAFVAAYTTVRQFAEFGADQAELDRALADVESYFKQALQGANTRNSRNLAESLVQTVADGDVFTSPQQDWDYFQSLKPSVTLDRINSGIKPLFAGDGPLLWHTGETLGNLDKQAFLDTYNAIQAAKLTAAETRVNKPWPYTNFGTPAKVVKREVIQDLGITQLTYANGVRATIKTTDFKADDINVTVRFAGGLSSLSPSSKPPVFAASVSDLAEGGLGKLTASELKDSLTGKIYSVGLGIGEDATSLSGGTNKTDFATEMELLMAFTTDAAYNADALERLKSLIPDYYRSLNSTPGGVFQMNGNAVLHNNDPRFVMPTQEQLMATTNDQVKALIDHQLKTGPIEITIVGDISEAEAEAQIARTFGTLAKRGEKPVIPADALKVSFPTTNLNPVFEHQGRADQDLSYIAWPGADFTSDTRRARALSVLAEVMSLRLIDVVREKKGISYSPYASNTYSQTFPGYGYLSVTAQVKPEDDQVFYDAVTEIVADLKAHPISDDELLRAQKPLLDRMDTDLKTNTYWFGALPGSATDPRKLDYIRTRRDQYKAVTVADIQRLANQYLDMKKAVRITVKPAAAAKGATATQ
ncbi:M16 family metallopeptidase [Asticcacaulis sp. 201]|uniref:M16 family metallopeptidase n=1 Tax=Asticcacaulis sp. 201 TaxID=3028787 RepID=UPI00291685DF|nr:insulinase family protein [Asticcacaulis sp. 201]MDV6332967.1 insulinase family protein [Asticcacaulis sp. 201]